MLKTKIFPTIVICYRAVLSIFSTAGRLRSNCVRLNTKVKYRFVTISLQPISSLVLSKDEVTLKATRRKWSQSVEQPAEHFRSDFATLPFLHKYRGIPISLILIKARIRVSLWEEKRRRYQGRQTISR